METSNENIHQMYYNLSAQQARNIQLTMNELMNLVGRRRK